MSEFRDYVDGIKFETSWKRYRKQPVDDFVAKVRENVASMEEELNALRAENEKYKAQTEQIVGALITAQVRSREIMDDASKKAADIVGEAEKEKESRLEEMRQKDIELNEEYESKKNDLAKNVDALVEIKNQFQETIEKDIIGFLARMKDLGSTRFLEQLSEEQKETLKLTAKKDDDKKVEVDENGEVKGSEGTEKKFGIDLKDLNIDLPDDTELKSIIEDLF